MTTYSNYDAVVKCRNTMRVLAAEKCIKNNKYVRLGCDRSNIDSGGGHHQLDDVRRLFVCLTTEKVKFIQGFKKHRAIELNWAGSAKPRPIRTHRTPP